MPDVKQGLNMMADDYVYEIARILRTMELTLPG